jgi:endonuclease YncB( thermonuclease family)
MGTVKFSLLTAQSKDKLQDEAREAKRGLWAGEPVRPWEFRKNRKEKR